MIKRSTALALLAAIALLGAGCGKDSDKITLNQPGLPGM